MFVIKGLDRFGNEQVLFPREFASRQAAQDFINDHLLPDAWSRVWVAPADEEAEVTA